jgi:hypothetical protein
MLVLLSNGREAEIKVGGATMGLEIRAAALNSHDLRSLLQMDDSDLRGWLSSLRTRFEPQGGQDAGKT